MIDPYQMAYINVVLSVLMGIGIFFFRFIYPKKPLNYFYLLLLLSFLPLVSILRTGVYESGDFTIHTKFAMQFFHNLQEGNLIPRWVPDHCGGYGCPVYMFLYSLPYYLISFIHFLGFTFIDSMKLFLMLSFVLSGIGMYVWIKSEINEKSGFVAAIFYLFAPYHLIDLHFRASVGELMSMTILPFVFYFCKRLLDTGKSHFFIALAFLLSFLILSHQATSVISFPLFILYGLYIWNRKKSAKIRDVIVFAASLISGIGLSAFYWLPVMLEGKYIQFVRENVFEFNHLLNFFFSPGRLGLLFQGMYGQLYFTIGYTQWLVIGLGVYLLFKGKVAKRLKPLLIACLILSFIFFILMLEFTLPFWRVIPFLNNFIYTWRLFIELIVLLSLIAAIVVNSINRTSFMVILCIVTIMYTLLNWSNRRMIPDVTDEDLRKEVIFTEKAGELEITTPIWVDDRKEWVGKKPKSQIEIIKGDATISNLSRTTTTHEYLVSAKSHVLIKENTFYFPGWKVFANEKEIPIIYTDKRYPGVIHFQLTEGLHYLTVQFDNTPVRQIGILISLFTLILLLATWLKNLRRLFTLP